MRVHGGEGGYFDLAAWTDCGMDVGGGVCLMETVKGCGQDVGRSGNLALAVRDCGRGVGGALTRLWVGLFFDGRGCGRSVDEGSVGRWPGRTVE